MMVRASVLFAIGTIFPADVPGDRPNVVVLLADDLGWGDPACYGAGSKIATPCIDALAREGMRFTDAHSPSAVCTPTRYGLLTGRYCWRTRLKEGVLWSGYARALRENGPETLPAFLAEAGYRTAAVGKWHLGFDWCSTDGSLVDEQTIQAVDWGRPVAHGPSTWGFDFTYLLPASLDMPPYLWLRDDRAVRPATDHTPGSERRWSGGGGFWRAGAIAPGFRFEDVLPTITERAVAFVEQHVRDHRDTPFFLYVAFASPHTPWVPTEEWQGRSGAGWYGDFVAQTDAAIGRVLAALERNGVAGDTLVICTSDNGAHWPLEQQSAFDHPANGPWRGMKADIFEGGHRVPLVVRWPGRVAAGSSRDALVCLTDVFATCAALLDMPLARDAAEDSVSFLSVLQGRSETARDSVVLHSLRGTFALRRGPWKLIEGNRGSGGFTAPVSIPPSDGVGGQLYHLGEDPGEAQDRFAGEPQIVAELTRELSAVRQSLSR